MLNNLSLNDQLSSANAGAYATVTSPTSQLLATPPDDARPSTPRRQYMLAERFRHGDLRLLLSSGDAGAPVTSSDAPLSATDDSNTDASHPRSEAGLSGSKRKRVAKHQSNVPGVTYDKSCDRWVVHLGDSNSKITVSVSISKHDGDVDAARDAAEVIAQEIRNGTYVPESRASAIHQSNINGVSYDTSGKVWRVRVKKDGKTHHASVSIKKHGGNVNVARKEAEEIAEAIRNGTYVSKSKTPAVYQSPIQGVNWDASREEWKVRVGGLYGSVPATGDIKVDAARKEAEKMAEMFRVATAAE
jgi:hypothetical protein